jgi:hypothetical protein
MGYSGHGEGLNNPSLSHVHDVGPIPRGAYLISSFFTDPEKGPIVARLSPEPGTETYGRSGFMLHGDNARVNHTASLGCIIQGHDVRQAVAVSGDYELAVI